LTDDELLARPPSSDEDLASAPETMQRRLEVALRARGSARAVLRRLERRARAGEEVVPDRLAAALDRSMAADDRVAAAMDRHSAAVLLKHSRSDELTGAITRAAGLEQLEDELERARRDRHPLVLAFVDVDGLKAVNDSRGHLAGDAVLRAAGQSLNAHVRRYDLVVRYGGDEFLCALNGVHLEEARERFTAVAVMLDALSPGSRVSVGYALSTDQDTVADLVGRADRDLYRGRAARPRQGRRVIDLLRPREATASSS
jgi:diguanylate cyclase (GGDEF)-like protein